VHKIISAQNGGVIFVHSWAAAGALLLGITAIGGILTHIRVKDSFKQTSTILFLGILAFILFFIRLSDFSNFPG
jgi:putative oxidoreductase